MTAKIPLNKIAELTAESSSEDLASTLQFIKDLFSIVEDEVARGNEVRIAGLGVFVKSGIIDEPISFLPEEDFAAQLNEAFSMFSPVELNDEVSENELASADYKADDIKTEIEGNESQIQAVPESKEDEKHSSEDNDEAKEPPCPSVDDTVKDEFVADTIQPEEDSDMKASEETSTPVELPLIDEIGQEPEATVRISDIDENKTAPATAPDIETVETIQLDEVSVIPEEDVEYVVVRKSKSRFSVGMFLGLIIGFALGVIAFLAYIVQILQVRVEDVFPF